MSLAINITTPEGMILAADSRQSFFNKKGVARIGSDNASKLFKLNDRIGVAIAGLAFLEEEGEMKNISKFIAEYRQTKEIKELDVKEVTEGLFDLFNKKYKWKEKLEKLPSKIETNLRQQGCEVLEIKKEQYSIKFRFKNPQGNIKDGISGVNGNIELLIGGYNKDFSYEAYNCYIPGEIQQKRNSKIRGKECGASWIGQKDVIGRIVLGYDNRIRNLKFINESMQKLGSKEISDQLMSLEYVIQWGTMTLQDATDFCVLMIQTTSAIQKFSDGIMADPGDIPGVGGPIDIAAITPNKGFFWIKRKELKIEKAI